MNISEEIRAVLYDDQNISDVYEVDGEVQCKVCITSYWQCMDGSDAH